MIKVKVCGIRRSEDIAYANAHKPDYIGFVFAKSKRQVTAEQAATLRERLNKNIICAGVFVNENIDMVLKTAKICALDVIQLHGDEDLQYIQELVKKSGDYTIWKAVRVRKKRDILTAAKLPADKILLDSYSPSVYGGSGKPFDWSLLDQLDADFIKQRIILSGGLNVRNAADILKKVRPYGMDVSSGVETDGFKDEEKIEAFIRAVQTTRGNQQ